MKQTVHKIFGPPGTGKTTRLTQIVRDHMRDGLPLSNIAYLAHTKAAADEAYSRVEDLAGSGRPKYFCTIHAAARRMTDIGKAHIWGPREWYELSQAVNMRFNVGAEFDDNSGDTVGDPIIQCINFAKARMISIGEAMQNFARYPIVSPVNIQMVSMAMEAIKKSKTKFDFDDMLKMYYDNPVPLPVDLVMVDEAQDLSVFQWKIVQQMWANARKVVICGDDDQSIYSFLGADPDGFLQFPCDTSEVLPVSYRVPRDIGRVAERIIKPVEKRQKKLLAWRDAPGVINQVYATPQTLPIKSGEKTLVLVRHNIQGRAVYKAIREEGIPVAYNGESYLMEKEAKALAIYYRLRDGGECGWNEAIAMLSQMPGKQASVERIRELRKQEGKTTKRLTAKDFDVPWVSNPVNYFGLDMASSKIFAACCWNVEKFGPGILLKIPDVNVMTIHASKGREADHVIVLTDCYASVWEEQQGKERDTERKVAYVAVTRAKQRLTIVQPRTNMFLRAVLDAV